MAATTASVHNIEFDPTAVEAVVNAFDQACAELRKRGSAECVDELVAALIINLATCGEKDPHRLCKRALDVIRQQA